MGNLHSIWTYPDITLKRAVPTYSILLYKQRMKNICNCTEIYRITKRVDELERIVAVANTASTGLASYADKWWIVTTAYILVIFPWGIMYNLDFISEKWRTVHRTRFLGRLHLAVAIVPMSFIIFYAHLQRISQDYKEMMTAVVAIFMSLYHVMRTCWGLMQVDNFSKWCSVLVDRMLRMKMILDLDDWSDIYKHEWMQEDDRKLEEIKQQIDSGGLERLSDYDIVRFGHEVAKTYGAMECEEYFKKRLEKLLLKNANTVLRVNNSVVDNELAGTDTTLKIDKGNLKCINPSGFLKMEDKELCCVRWSGSVLSSFGEYWSGRRKKAIDEDKLFERCRSSLDVLELVTFPVNEKKVSFSKMKWRDGGPYKSSLELSSLNRTPNWLRHRKRELENLMGGFPGAGPRQKLRRPEVVLVHALLYAQSMDEITFDSLIQYCTKSTSPVNYRGWSLLLWQNGELTDPESYYMNPLAVPPFPWRRLMVPLWDKCTNWRVLQASVHVDNSVNFDTSFFPKENADRPGCWFEYTHKNFTDYNSSYNSCNPRYTGSVLESVRTFLAYWISTSTEILPDWRPMLPAEKFIFSINQDIVLDNNNNLDFHCMKLWRWECQSELQRTISDMDIKNENLASSIELILLFILGFPGIIDRLTEASSETLPIRERNESEEIEIVTEFTEGARVHRLEFKPHFAPQNIKVRILIFEYEGKDEKTVEIQLITGACVTEFYWEDWINSIMGFIKATDDAVSRKEIAESIPLWRKRTPSKVNLNRPLILVSSSCEGSPEKRRDVQIWNGWPFFDIKIVQFEMKNWIGASIHSCGNSKSVDEFRASEVQSAEEELMRMASIQSEIDYGFRLKNGDTYISDRIHGDQNHRRLLEVSLVIPATLNQQRSSNQRDVCDELCPSL